MTKRTFEAPPAPQKTQRHQAQRITEAVGAGIRIVGLLAGLLFVLFWCSGFTMIQPNEVALVLRFGKLVGPGPEQFVHPPGLLLALPYPIDEVIRIPEKQEREVVISRLQFDTSNQGSSLDPIRDGYVLCGDQHILRTKVRIKYRISDPVAFQFQSVEPERVLQEVVCASIVQTMNKWNAMDALRLQRSIEGEPTEQLAQVIRQKSQADLNELGIGVTVTAIEFREILPTPQLAQAFQNVQSEQIGIETRKREAEGFAALKVPEAESRKYSLINGAKRQKTDQSTTAREEVTLFQKVFAQYQINPKLVWSRLYLDAIEVVMQQVGEIRYAPERTRLILSPGIKTDSAQKRSTK